MEEKCTEAARLVDEKNKLFKDLTKQFDEVMKEVEHLKMQCLEYEIQSKVRSLTKCRTEKCVHWCAHFHFNLGLWVVVTTCAIPSEQDTFFLQEEKFDKVKFKIIEEQYITAAKAVETKDEKLKEVTRLLEALQKDNETLSSKCLKLGGIEEQLAEVPKY